MKLKNLQMGGGFYIAVALMGSLYGCSKADESSPQPQGPEKAQISNLKNDPTGQYVDKSVQVRGYEDGRERPTRFKKDKPAKSISGNTSALLMPEDPDSGGGGGYSYFTGVGAYKFVSSAGLSLDGDNENPGQYILDLKIAKGGSTAAGPEAGYAKLDLDLNSGAGGKYIYLCYSRHQVNQVECEKNQNWSTLTPVADIKVKAWSAFSISTRPDNFCGIETPDGTPYGYKVPDLNDGSGGSYIYAYQSKVSTPTPIREVGIVAGNSSNIWPPSGWVRTGDDCNKGAGGDYVYFCYKR